MAVVDAPDETLESEPLTVEPDAIASEDATRVERPPHPVPVSRWHQLGRWLPTPTGVATVAVVLLATAVGLYLRIRFYSSIEPGPDSDEAEMGLLGQQLLNGEFPLLMRNQPYAGTPWLFVIATSIRALGMGEFGLRAPIVLLGLANAALCLFIVRTIGWSWVRSAATAAVSWCYPIAAVFFASRETMYFVPAVTLGLVTVLVVLRADVAAGEDDVIGAVARSRWLMLAAGFAAGVGWWINPGSLYLSGPAFAWVAFRSLHSPIEPVQWSRRLVQVLRAGLPALVGFAIGAYPWIFLTVLGPSRRNNYADRPNDDVVSRVKLFFTEQIPGFTGFKAPLGALERGAWMGGWPWVVAAVALGVLLVVQLVRPPRGRRETIVTFLGTGVFVVFLVLTSQTGAVYANLRYIFFAAPVFPLLVAARWRNDLAALGALAVLPVVALIGSLSWQSPPAGDIQPAVDLLDSRGDTCVIGDYWAGGHRLMYASEGQIVAVSTYENRNPLYVDQAEDRGNCPWIFFDGQKAAAAFEGFLDSEGIDFTTERPGGGVVLYFPEQRVWVDDVPPQVRVAN